MWIWSSQQLRKGWEIAGLRSFRTTLLVDHPTQAVLTSWLRGQTGAHLCGHHISHPEVSFLLMTPPLPGPPTAENVSTHPFPHHQGVQLGMRYRALGPDLMDHCKNGKPAPFEVLIYHLLGDKMVWDHSNSYSWVCSCGKSSESFVLLEGQCSFRYS